MVSINSHYRFHDQKQHSNLFYLLEAELILLRVGEFYCSPELVSESYRVIQVPLQLKSKSLEVYEQNYCGVFL